MALRWADLMKQLSATAKEKEQPISAGFELTSRCNLQCKMCYVCRPPGDQEARSKELPASQWIALAKDVRDAGVLFLTLTGGEVFIRKDFKEIYEEIVKMGFVTQIYTNGSMITPDIIKWLSKIPPAKVSITVYGQSRETYQIVTGHANAYDRTMQAIDGLRAADIITEMKTTVIRDNMNEFDNIRKLALDRNIPFSIVNYVSPRREGSNSDPEGCRLSSEELVKYESYVNSINRQLKIEAGEIPVVFDDAVSDEEPSKNNSFDPNDAFRCGAAKSGFWITWDGRLTPCGLLDQPNVSMFDRPFSDAWEELKHKCKLIPPCEECNQCKYRSTCDSCPARMFTETGRHNQPAPYLCENARLRFESLISLNQDLGLEKIG